MRIELRNINKSYNKKIIFNKANLILEDNFIYGLVAPNGIGKTTLMNIISEIIIPDSGEIFYKELSKNDIYIVSGDDRGLYMKNTVKENLCYFAALKKITRKEVFENIKDNEIFLKLYMELKDSLCESLSLGQRKIIKILISFFINSKCILIDEANAGLDIYKSQKLEEILKEISKNKILLVSSHDLNFLSHISNSYIFIDNNKIIKKDKLNNELSNYFNKYYGDSKWNIILIIYLKIQG